MRFPGNALSVLDGNDRKGAGNPPVVAFISLSPGHLPAIRPNYYNRG
jgi:hypothetical protein